MADEVSPTMDEATEATPEPTEVVNEQMSEEAQLLATLKEAAITKKEQLDGTIRNAKRQYESQSVNDRLANELNELKQLVAQGNKPTRSETEHDDYGQPVDLAGEMNKILDARDRAKEQAQRQQQEAMMSAWNQITGDSDYSLVKDVWEKKLQDPNFVFSIQSGQKNPMMEYQETLREFYKGVARKSVATIEKLQKGVAPSVHVESGDARSPNMPTDEDIAEQDKLLNEMKDRADSGQLLSEDDELAALQAVLSKG